MLLGQRDVQSVVGRRRLQFEVEGAAEALAQRQSPGLVDASAKRRVNDELHAAGFIEETFGDDRLLVGTSPSTARPATMYSMSCSAPASSSPHSFFRKAIASCTSADISMPAQYRDLLARDRRPWLFAMHGRDVRREFAHAPAHLGNVPR